MSSELEQGMHVPCNKRMQSDFGELALPSAADARRYELKLSILENKLENSRSYNPTKIW